MGTELNEESFDSDPRLGKGRQPGELQTHRLAGSTRWGFLLLRGSPAHTGGTKLNRAVHHRENGPRSPHQAACRELLISTCKLAKREHRRGHQRCPEVTGSSPSPHPGLCGTGSDESPWKRETSLPCQPRHFRMYLAADPLLYFPTTVITSFELESQGTRSTARSVPLES